MINHAQVQIGMRISVMPLARRSRVVAMKFSEPSSCPTQKSGDGNGPEILPPAKTGTRVLANGAERRVSGPSGNRGSIGNKKCQNEDEEADERGPERHHVEPRKRHVFRADLNRQKIIAKASKRGVGQDEEHHERSVHGQQ